MTAVSATSRFDRAFFAALADWLAVGVAVTLPWSTSATSICVALWLVVVLATLEPRSLKRELLTPAGGLPVLLCVLGTLGMAWADVSWAERLGGLDSFVRLLVIPVLLTQFRRSDNGVYVLYGFIAAAACLLLTSWAIAYIPPLESHGNFRGVPVKDYIYQTDEFLICAFALLGVAGELALRRRWRTALLPGVLGLFFLANLAFVFTSRTGLLVLPFLVAALGWRLSRAKGVVVALLIASVIAPALWFSSPHLRSFTLDSVTALRSYLKSDVATSSGLHIEFLKKSLGIVADAPFIGHGTGSIPEQFRHAAAGESGAGAVATVNPHNQIFAVAIQLGCVGAAVLVAMWIAHLLLFRGPGWVAWAGMVVVIENVVSSTVNSHLFDFSQGWLYVFGVGVAGGMVRKRGDTGSDLSQSLP
ncbi:MAG: O-antigen ligase family protein [Xanthobacteraceae bacterium]